MRFRLALAFFVASALALAADPLEFQIGAFTFERPAGWKWITPSGPMRRAQLEVPGTDNEKADVTFFHFGSGQGGGIEANIDRWLGQFQGGSSSRSESAQGRTRIYFVQASGTFQSGMPGGPTTPLENQALFGAIIADAESGDVFVKMTGPKALVDSASVLFKEMTTRAAATRSEPSHSPSSNP
ncbi:MAG: hypothetical protein WCG66_09215 [bacterium]